MISDNYSLVAVLSVSKIGTIIFLFWKFVSEDRYIHIFGYSDAVLMVSMEVL